MPNLAQRQRGWGRRKPGPGYRIDGGHPLARGLVGCWLLNEGGGANAHDLSKTAAMGTVNNPTAAWGPGLFGGPAMVGNGSNVYMTVPALATTPTSVTVLAWARSPLPTTTQQLWSDSGDVIALRWYDQFNGTLPAWICQTAPGYQIINGPVAAANDMRQLVGVYDGVAQSMAFYINGSAVSNKSSAGALLTVGSFAVGQKNNATYPFTGPIDHAAIWNRALSAAEILQLYAEPFAFIAQAAPRRAFFGPAGVAATFGLPRPPFVSLPPFHPSYRE